jgi:hypothetical protein
MAKPTDPGAGPSPAKHFAVPHQQKYPVHNEAAAKGSLGAVARHGTAAEKAQVRAAVAARHPGMQQSTKPLAMGPMPVPQGKNPQSMGPMPMPPGKASSPWEAALSKPKPDPTK